MERKKKKTMKGGEGRQRQILKEKKRDGEWGWGRQSKGKRGGTEIVRGGERYQRYQVPTPKKEKFRSARCLHVCTGIDNDTERSEKFVLASVNIDH